MTEVRLDTPLISDEFFMGSTVPEGCEIARFVNSRRPIHRHPDRGRPV